MSSCHFLSLSVCHPQGANAQLAETTAKLVSEKVRTDALVVRWGEGLGCRV